MVNYKTGEKGYSSWIKENNENRWAIDLISENFRWLFCFFIICAWRLLWPARRNRIWWVRKPNEGAFVWRPEKWQDRRIVGLSNGRLWWPSCCAIGLWHRRIVAIVRFDARHRRFGGPASQKAKAGAQVNRPKGNVWSAIPVALLCMTMNRNERKQGSGPKRDKVL